MRSSAFGAEPVSSLLEPERRVQSPRAGVVDDRPGCDGARGGPAAFPGADRRPTPRPGRRCSATSAYFALGESSPGLCPHPFDPATATIAIVTYNRSRSSDAPADSIIVMDPKPGHVVVIDNASDRRHHRGRRVVPRTPRHASSSTGASRPTRAAPAVSARACASLYELGSTWMWLMDDDVEVLRDGLAGRWASGRPGSRASRAAATTTTAASFYWQYRLSIPFGIPIPFAPAGFADSSGVPPMNSRMLRGHVHPPRHRAAGGGLPDPRFFIYWDDSVYGWLASRKTTAVIVDEFVLRRTREIRQWDMGIRHLNASSDAYRYHHAKPGIHPESNAARSGSTTGAVPSRGACT